MAGPLHVTLDPAGRITALLSGGLGEDGIPPNMMRVARGDAAGFEPARRIGGDRLNFGRLASDSSGRVVGTWSQHVGGARHRVIGWMSPGDSDELSTEWRDLTRRHARFPAELPLGWGGHGVAVWQERYRPNRLLSSSIDPGESSFGEPEPVSRRLPFERATLAAVAVGRDGGGDVAWAPLRGDGGTTDISLATRGSAPRCRGWWATVAGSQGEGVLRGTRGRRDVISGHRGDDRIHGRGGNNLICGGLGDDVIRGGKGNNRVHAGPGDDRVVIGARGRNQVFARQGRNTIRCGPGRDRVVTNAISRVHRSCDRVVRR